MKRCPKCNSPMPPDELHCIRCGFDLPPKTKHETNDSSGASQAATGNAVGAQLNWGAISAQKTEKRESKGWLIFLATYLALFAFIAIRRPEAFSSGEEVAAIAFSCFVLALIFQVAFRLLRRIGKAILTMKKWISGYDARSPQRINWTRVFAVVLTSNGFFFTSCTGGFIASYISFRKMGGQYMDQGAKPYDGMAVIAAVPNPAKQGAFQFERVRLRDMEKFKTANPTHSFLLPPGSGQIERHDTEKSTTYVVQPAGDGNVLVETTDRGMMGTVIARYEATDKSVRPIFTNVVAWFPALIFGFMLASVLYIIGRVLRYWAAKRL